MSIVELVRLTLDGNYPLIIYWEMRRGIFRILRRRFRKAPVSKDRPRITSTGFRQAIEGLGLERGDTVLIHSGLGNIGIIEGGRKFVFELLAESVDVSKGNLLFPTFSFYPRLYDYLESDPIFDVKFSPTYMGTLSQYALKTKLGLRSIHPSHSLLAIGKDSVDLCCEHHLDSTPFGSRSPLRKMLEFQGAKILLLGVSTDAITLIHGVEDMMGDNFPIRVYTPKIYITKCVDWKGNALIVKTRCHTPAISLARYIPRFDHHMKKDGVILRAVEVGNSNAMILDAHKFCKKLLSLAMAGKTVYGNTRHVSALTRVREAAR